MPNRVIAKLMSYAKKKLDLPERDEEYARNAILSILRLDAYEDCDAVYEGESPEKLLNELSDICVKAHVAEESEREALGDAVMGALMLAPSAVEREFEKKRRISPQAAMDWLYDYSVAADYVKKEKLDKNPRFEEENGLIVTINLAKPEFRDPKKAKSGNSTKSGYPKCTICRENEGFAGRNKRTLRTVTLELGGEEWFWQYSPYGYFYQHGIAVNREHTPMHVDGTTFYKLMDFVDAFPHFFIGCNAALPRIGGSVLSHDHFQGGGETLPIFKAKIAVPMQLKEYPAVSVGVLDWFGTAIRVTGKNRDDVAAVCEKIRKAWVSYRDEEKGLIPVDDEGVHHAVSPTVLKTENGYEMTLILRSNITSEEFPDGVFHAHPEFHVIKKEAIGLIEAQGLFILPGRLVDELSRVAEAMVKGEALPQELQAFEPFRKNAEGGERAFTLEGAQAAIRRALSRVCEKILQNTAVFKTFAETKQFLRGVGCDEV